MIKSVGYEAKVTRATKSAVEGLLPLVLAPVPEGSPVFFVEAMARAKEAERPVIIDFWAEWCAPCKRLKAVTMADTDVAAALEHIEVIFVDLDEHPELAKTYNVTSIPDVFFVNAEGTIVDRLKRFEEAGPFLERVERL